MKKYSSHKKGFRTVKKRVPLFTFLGTYLLILVIPISISILFYSRTLSIMYESTNDSNRRILQHASAVLNERIDEISVMANQIATNHFVMDFQGKTDPFQYPNSYSIIETRRNLPGYGTTNEFIFDYYIFFNKSNLVMNNQITYTYPQFYTIYMNFDSLSYTDWIHQTLEESLHPAGLQQETGITMLNGQVSSSMQVIPFYHPLLTHGKNDGFILILIPKKEIASLLSSIELGEGGAVFIEDKEGNVITHISENTCDIGSIQSYIRASSSTESPSNISVEGKNMLVTRVETAAYRYVAIQSEDVVLKKMNSLKLILFTILLVSGALSVAAAFYFARRTAKPLQEIFNNLPEDENKAGDIFSIIKSAVIDVRQSNLDLQKVLTDQIPYLKSTFLSRLIHSDIHSPEEIHQIISRYIPTTGHKYCILIVKSDIQRRAWDELELAVVSTFSSLMKQTFTGVIEDAVYCDIDEQRLAVMLYYPFCSNEEFRRQAEDAVMKVQNRLPITIVDSISIAGGTIVTDLIQLPDSYEKAQTAFNQNYIDSHTSVLWYEERKHGRSSYYFPPEIESQLANSVKEGDSQAAQRLLLYLFKRNFENRDLSAPLQKFFIYQLVCTLTKLSSQIDLDEKRYAHLIKELDHILTAGEWKQQKILLEACTSMCEAVNEQSGACRNSSLNRQILSYIRGHFCEASISLSSIADHFSMNESYLSCIFKQQNSIKLSVYIENLRIEKAKELLTGTSLTIHQIAEKIGYLSSNSFCRAFKRVTGVNATTYRSCL